MYVPAVCAATRKPHHSQQEMRNGKRGNGTARLGHYTLQVGSYIKQDSRVYMLCKVAQVFSARGGRSIVLFVSLFSGKGSGYMLAKYVHTLQFFGLCYY